MHMSLGAALGAARWTMQDCLTQVWPRSGKWRMGLSLGSMWALQWSAKLVLVSFYISKIVFEGCGSHSNLLALMPLYSSDKWTPFIAHNLATLGSNLPSNLSTKQWQIYYSLTIRYVCCVSARSVLIKYMIADNGVFWVPGSLETLETPSKWYLKIWSWSMIVCAHNENQWLYCIGIPEG